MFNKNTYFIKWLLFHFSFFIFHFSFAQSHADKIVPLHTNPVLLAMAKERAKNNHLHKITPPPPNPIKMLNLPFLDDFSKPSPYPDPNMWQNNEVFVNYTYPVCPHTLGVATFDGLNSVGMPYDPDCPLNAAYPADTLTSQFIALADVPTLMADSVYLSFYWQAGGLGSPPQPNDTLILEFFNGNTWNEVWYQLGYTPVPPDTGFHLAMIPVIDSQYFINGFQFRFRNYANTSGNLDHWNIDEVYMNHTRNYMDTFQHNVSFVYECPSILKNYEFEPWEQFIASDLKTNITALNRDNDSGYNFPNVINTQYHCTATPSGFLTPYSGGVQNATAFWKTGYMNYQPFTNPNLVFNYTPLTGPTTYNITQILTTSPNFDAWDDTLRFNQIFSNYYAYDDGTAEASYLLNGNDNPVKLACQFTLNNPDTLTGIYMNFDYVITNASGYTFLLTVWNDAGGMPGSVLYENDSIYSPIYDSLNQFIYYKFNKNISLPANTPVYIGFTQTFGDSINIGWDWNNNNEYKIFYNVGLGWNYSSYQGSVMLRPVFGKPANDFNSINEIERNKSSLILYPNPAQDKVFISQTILPGAILRIYGADGKLWIENDHFSGNLINTSIMPKGFYIVEIISTDGNAQYLKLLKN